MSSLTLQQQQSPLGDGEYKLAQKKDPYYGADWGMRWWTAVAIMLVVGIVTPVFYLLYYEVLMKADVSHHGVPTQPHNDMHDGHLSSSNLELPDGKDIQKGAKPGDNAGDVFNGNLQGPDVDKSGADEHGILAKT